jgi:hypothetical protein
MKRWAIVSAGFALAASMSCLAEEPAKSPRSRIMLMLETKFVPGRKLKGPADEYVRDGDRNTIELVELPKDDPGPSRVASDGQVIFLTRADMRSGTTNDDLMEQAFDILEKHEAEAAKPPAEASK